MPDPGLPAFGSYGFGMPAPQPGNWLTAGLSSGWHQSLGALGGAGQAVSQVLGMPDAAAQWGRVAAAQSQQATDASRPDLEQAPWYQPSALGYRLAQMIPAMGVGIAGAAVGGAFAPEAAAGAGASAIAAAAGRGTLARMIGGAAAMYPQIAGSNVEAAKQAGNGELSQSDAAKSLALGVPEAAAAGFVPGRLAGMFEHGVAGSLGVRALKGAAAMGGYNAAQMAGQSAITQQAFTPDMPVADRARGIVDAAMSGLLGGAVFGGLTAAVRPAIKPLANVPAAEVSTAAIDASTKLLEPPRVYSGPGGASTSLDAAAQAAHEQAQQPVNGPVEGRALATIPGEEAKGGAPLYAGREGVGISPDVVERDALARAAVGATTPPSDQLALAAPTAVSGMTDAELQAQNEALLAKSKRPGRGGFDKGGLGTAQAALYTMTQEEIARRTPPGAKVAGPDTLMFTPEEAQQRAGQVAAFKAQVTEGLPKPALKDPLIANFNSTDPPDLINELRNSPRFDAFINDGKTPPKWFQTLATKYGVMDGANDAPTPAARVEAAGQKMIATSKQIMSERDPDARAKLIEQYKTKDLPAYRDAQQVEQWHAEADARDAAAKPMGEPNAVQEPSAAGVDAREQARNGAGVGGRNPEGDAVAPARQAEGGNAEGEPPAFSYLEKFYPEEPEAGAPAREPTPVEAVASNMPTKTTAEELKAPANVPPEQEAPKASARAKVAQLADHERLQMAVDGEDGKTPQSAMYKQKMQEALASGNPAKISAALARYDKITESQLRAPRSDMADRDVGAPVARFQEGAPDWVQGHIKDTGGTMVYEDGENALIRGLNASGRPVYFGVNRALGMRSMEDVSGTPAPWMTPKLNATLRAAANQDRALNAALARAKPDGPFNGKAGQVVGTPSADPRVVSYVKGLLTQLGLGNLRVLIAHPADMVGAVADKAGLNGDFMPARSSGMAGEEHGHVRFFGPEAQDAYIYIRPGMSDGRTVETAAHEVGHLIDEVALRTAPTEVRSAVDAAYDRWYRTAQGIGTTEELMRIKRPLAAFANSQRAIETGEVSKTTSGLAPDTLQYLLSKKEWFADQVARYATMTAKPRTLLEQFFSGVAQKLRALASLVTGHSFLPDDAVKEFLDHLGPGSDQQWMSMGPRQRLNLMQQDREPIRDPRQMESAVKGVVQAAESVAPKVVSGIVDGTTNLRGSARRFMAQLASGYGIRDGRIAATVVPALKEHALTAEARRYDEQAKNKVNVLPQHAMEALPEAKRQVAQQFMLDAQQWRALGINPYKAWTEHSDLLKAPNSADLFRTWQAARSSLDHVRQIGAHDAVDSMFTVARTAMYQRLAAQVYDLGYRKLGEGQDLGLPKTPTGETFREHYEMQNDAHTAHDYWRTVIDGMSAIIDHHIANNETTASIMEPPAAEAHRNSTADLREMARDIKKGMAQVADGMYAPVQHGTGRFFVSAKLATGLDGKVKPEAIAAMQKMVQDGDWHFGMYSLGDDQAKFFTRVDSAAKMGRLNDAMVALKAAGHLDPDEPIKAGDVHRLDASPHVTPYEVHEAIERFKKSLPANIDGDTRDALIRNMTDQWLDMRPDHSLQHFLQNRTLTHGYDPNMQANMSLYLKAAARNSSMVERSGAMAAARQAMIQQVEDAKSNPNLTMNQRGAAHDLAQEMLTREAQQSWNLSNPALDLATAAMHSIIIGFSPAYFFTMQSQLATLGWGELAKVHGFAGAAKYMAGATGRAFKLLNAVASSKDWASLGLRDTSMRGHGSEKDIATLMKLDAAGGMTQFTSGMTDAGSTALVSHEKFQKYANFMGLYSETLPRFIMALAAADAHDANPGKTARAGFASREDYIKSVVNGSQFQWGPEMASRFTGKAGFFGAYGKIAFGFTRFHTMLIEKQYREMHDLIAPLGGDAETRRQAGTFLAAHLVAVTALAGTLGLPMAAAFTGAADKVLSTLNGEDDVDVEGLYRTWLSHTFGPDVGDVLAKGLPRALGVDFSHLGDQNILPGTSLLTDKRKLEDRLRDFTQTAAGPAVHEVSSLFLGARDVLNGDYMLGLTKILPEGFKGLAEAMYAGSHGFVDKYGQAVTGGQPTAADLAKMAIGLDPTTLARYNEAMRIFQANRAQQEYHEQNIQKHIMRSMAQRDPDTTEYWIRQAAEYTQQHPLMGGPLSNIGAALQQHMLAAAKARALGVPIGVDPRDVRMQGITRFLNPQ